MSASRFQISAEAWQGRQSEKQFQASVLEAAEWYGWELELRVDDTVYKGLGQMDRDLEERGATRGRGGRGAIAKARQLLADWPDVTLCHQARGRTLMIEFKTNTGETPQHQLLKLARLRLGGNDVRLWRPRWWELEIEPTLAGDLLSFPDYQQPIARCADLLMASDITRERWLEAVKGGGPYR